MAKGTACRLCALLRESWAARTAAISNEMTPEEWFRWDVAVIEHVFRDDREEPVSREVWAGRLRYCPECGANLRKRARKWRDANESS